MSIHKGLQQQSHIWPKGLLSKQTHWVKFHQQEGHWRATSALGLQTRRSKPGNRKLYELKIPDKLLVILTSKTKTVGRVQLTSKVLHFSLHQKRNRESLAGLTGGGAGGVTTQKDAIDGDRLTFILMQMNVTGLVSKIEKIFLLWK